MARRSLRIRALVVLMIGVALAPAAVAFAQAAAAPAQAAAAPAQANDPFGAPPPAVPPAAPPAAVPAQAENGFGSRHRSEAQRSRESQKMILKALAENTDCEFTKFPLSDVVNYFKGKHEIEIQLDGRALQDAKIDSDIPVTCALKEVTLKAALRLILGELNLVSVIQDGVLMVTTKAEAEKVSARTAEDGPLSTAAASSGLRTHGLAEAKILHALDGKTECDFTETPLVEVLEYFKGKHEFEIQVDTKALQEEAIDVSQPVTRSLKGVKFKSALRLILDELNLTYIIRDEVLLITTKVVADADTPTRIYAVQDLLAQWPTGELRASSLIRIVTGTVQPTTWDDNGGPSVINPLPGALVISNTQQVHEQVAELFTSMRKVKAAQIAEKAAGNATQGEGSDAKPAAKTMSIEVHRMPDVDADCLRAAIVALIAPATWKENGGEGSIEVVRAAAPRAAAKPVQPPTDKPNNAPVPNQAVTNQGAGSNQSPPAIVPHVPFDGLGNGPGTLKNLKAAYQPDLLVVRQTDEVHEAIEDLFDDIDRATGGGGKRGGSGVGASEGGGFGGGGSNLGRSGGLFRVRP